MDSSSFLGTLDYFKNKESFFSLLILKYFLSPSFVRVGYRNAEVRRGGKI
jgi:hypothetical protein